MKRKKLQIDACIGSQLRDTQGETLSVEGADISALEAGEGRWNDNHGKGFFNSLGRVTDAKKIFKREDCENDRQEYYWDKVKSPYIYAKGYLYTDEDHSNAKACAAILRNIHKTDAPLKIKASVEGGVVARGLKDPSLLARTKIHSVALTFTPANNATLVEPLNLQKSDNEAADMQLIKSVMHLAQDNVPSFRHITRNASAQKIINNIDKIRELANTTNLSVLIEESNVEELMKNAIMGKITANIKKINELVKVKAPSGLFPQPKTTPITKPNIDEKMNLLPQKVTDHRQEIAGQRQDKYQRDIGKLKAKSTTPTKPKATDSDGVQPLLTGAQLKTQNTFKHHASKAMKDKDHLLNLGKKLLGKGVEKHRIKKILNGIKAHVKEDVKKSNAMDPKKIIGKVVRNVAITAALAGGAHYFENDNKAEAKPKVVKQLPSIKNEGYDAYIGEFKETKKDKKKKKMKKALTAGYGGGGVPTSQTGGGTFQTESLDKDFKYITCQDCGKEQVYSPNQVRCRNCSKGFSMKEIYSMNGSK